MPYLDHFGFSQPPFALTPQRELFYPATHQRILDALIQAIERGEPILKVVGEVGTGKTLLCRLLLSDLTARGASVAFIAVPQADRAATMRAVCREFGIPADGTDDPHAALTERLIGVHAEGRQAVMVVDEAQALDREGLETIRLLSNLETDDRKLLHIVLFAQPEIDRLLRQYSMRQVTQRITFNFATEPFDVERGINYIRHRVEGCSLAPPPNDVFDRAAMKILVNEAVGVPRVINVLADRALLAAYADGDARVTRRHAKRAVRDITYLGPDRRSLLSVMLGRSHA